MTTFAIILMALLLVAALERAHRRQSPHPPGPHGSRELDDRDWVRTQSDLLALGERPDLAGTSPRHGSHRLLRHPLHIRNSRGLVRRRDVTARSTGSGQRMAGIRSD